MARSNLLAAVTLTLLSSLVSSGAVAGSEQLEVGYARNVGVATDDVLVHGVGNPRLSYESNAGFESQSVVEDDVPEARPEPEFREPGLASAELGPHPAAIDPPPSLRLSNPYSLSPAEAVGSSISDRGSEVGVASTNGFGASFSADRRRLNALNRLQFGFQNYELGYGDYELRGNESELVTYGLSGNRALVFGTRALGLDFSGGEGRSVVKFGLRKRRPTVELKLRF